MNEQAAARRLPYVHRHVAYVEGPLFAALNGVIALVVWRLLREVIRREHVQLPFALAWLWAPVVIALVGHAMLHVVVRVDARGIAVQRCWWGCVPVHTQRFGLGAHVEVYQSFEASEAEGIFVAAARSLRRGEYGQDSDCIGPAGNVAATEAARALNEALEVARAQAAEMPIALRCAPLRGQEQALELASAVRSPQGRLLSARTRAVVRVQRTQIPEGSTLHFNDARYIDPHADDALLRADVHEETLLRPGLRAQAGTQLWFDAHGVLVRMEGGAAGTLAQGALRFSTSTSLEFGKEGITLGTLAEELVCPWGLLPVGTRMQSRQGPMGIVGRVDGVWDVSARPQPGWYACLQGPLKLHDLALDGGDVLHLDARLRCAALGSARPVVVGGVQVVPKYRPLPLEHDGRLATGHRMRHALAVLKEVEKHSR